ncbi:MAG: serine protease [Treponema sp.]|jgi:serine protease Do|nr:serine protease [Treponema sp.]
MFHRRGLRGFVLFFCIVPVFAQTPLAQGPDPRTLQEFVGYINQSFRPETVSLMQNIAEELEQRGQRDAARGIEDYLQGSCGTGLVYVGADGANYIITSHRIISQAEGLSITFEKPDGSRTSFTGLSIAAADEEMDLALLVFENGERPFSEGPPLLGRQLWMEETVYAAGFSGAGKSNEGESGAGTTAVWEIEQGEVSDLYVYIPGNDEIMRMRGPYIRHTAPVDSGNSGGPLLARAPGAPAGYAVAGINTLSAWNQARAWDRAPDQGANYAIPIDRVEDFLQEVLGARNDRIALEERLLAFTQGLTVSHLSYQHIARYLSNSFTAENAGPALMLMLEAAPGPVLENTMRAFNDSPLEGINLAVAWAVGDYLQREHTGALDVETIESLNQTHYFISFQNSGMPNRSAGVPDNSEWVNEYGIWRIRRLSKFTTARGPERGEEEQESRLRTSYLFSLSAGYAYIFDAGHALAADAGLYLWHFGLGIRIYYGGASYLRGESALGFYLPIRIKDRFGITPFAGFGAGFVWKDRDSMDRGGTNLSSQSKTFDLCISGQGGLRITSSLAPGLFLQGMYQYNYEVYAGADKPNPHAFVVSIGYGF